MYVDSRCVWMDMPTQHTSEHAPINVKLYLGVDTNGRFNDAAAGDGEGEAASVDAAGVSASEEDRASSIGKKPSFEPAHGA